MVINSTYLIHLYVESKYEIMRLDNQSGTTIFDSYNVAFNGSFCVDGEGFGIVIRTGVNTVSLPVLDPFVAYV